MAKKERLANLLDSVEDYNQEETPKREVATSETKRKKTTTSKTEEGKPKRKVAGETSKGRATFVVSKEIVRKLKYIALVDDKLHQEVVAEALSAYIGQWEEENGKIKLPK